MRVLKKSQKSRKDFIRLYAPGEWSCSELNYRASRNQSVVTKVQGWTSIKPHRYYRYAGAMT